MDIDSLDAILIGKPLSKSEPKNGEWISFDEWQWRAQDKIFDAARVKAGLRPLPRETREKNLKQYLESRQNERAFVEEV